MEFSPRLTNHFGDIMSKRFLFFSVEAWAPSAKIIMDILYPIEQLFNEKYSYKYENEYLKQIAIIVMCSTKEKYINWYHERNYISRKHRFADMRLWIDFDVFMHVADDERKQMIWKTVLRALDNIRKKKAIAKIDSLEKDLFDLFWIE